MTASFTFNFEVDEENEENEDGITLHPVMKEEEDGESIQYRKKEEIRPAEKHLLTLEHRNKLNERIVCKSKIDKLTFPTYSKSILKVNLNVDTALSNEECSFVHELKNSDLISGLYEGGFKLWECSFDIINYLISNKMDLNGKRVLDCGCGHGLPGLYAILENATVDFQDYNWEVIHYLTMANVLLTKSEDAIQKCQFYSGDWQLLINLIPEKEYDLIVTSDTIYHTFSHGKLYSLMKHALKPDGEILVAAKRYYFGCGGNVNAFKQLVEKDGCMMTKTIYEITDGYSNIREIISIKFK
jgi:SAM-dependent methyltransferase